LDTWVGQLALAVFAGVVIVLTAWLAHQSNPRLDRAIGWFDAVMTIGMIAHAMLLIHSMRAADQECTIHGSSCPEVGAGEILLIIFYSVPGAIFSTVSWRMMWTRHPARYIFQSVATLCVFWLWVLVIVGLLNGDV
jgi:hypothetical protein